MHSGEYGVVVSVWVMMGFAVGVGGELVGGCVYGVDLLVKWLGLRVVVFG